MSRTAAVPLEALISCSQEEAARLAVCEPTLTDDEAVGEDGAPEVVAAPKNATLHA